MSVREGADGADGADGTGACDEVGGQLHIVFGEFCVGVPSTLGRGGERSRRRIVSSVGSGGRDARGIRGV